MYNTGMSSGHGQSRLRTTVTFVEVLARTSAPIYAKGVLDQVCDGG